ncbi:hypothetical protein NPS46_20670 [Pseudomonas putida]|uniref:hypothetical protein n=1 Tax=Pseudomonas putida TaxID=303 RepID=UPI0023649FF2|nr:hypothetical protein [Pseudomonas putida]MDD2054966.1 hypothetical protein [Pseudomonas putida]
MQRLILLRFWPGHVETDKLRVFIGTPDMKTSVFASFLLLGFTSASQASMTLCNIQDALFFKSVGWNTETKEAKVVSMNDEQFEGKVVLTRNRSNGIVTNIEFTDRYFTEGKQTGELMIFPVPGGFRVLGMRYTNTTPRRLDISYGNNLANCVTM